MRLRELDSISESLHRRATETSVDDDDGGGDDDDAIVIDLREARAMARKAEADIWLERTPLDEKRNRRPARSSHATSGARQACPVSATRRRAACSPIWTHCAMPKRARAGAAGHQSPDRRVGA